MTDPQPDSEAVKARREAIGISQATLAWAARVSRNTVGNLERGQGQPEGRVISNVSAALGWTLAFEENYPPGRLDPWDERAVLPPVWDADAQAEAETLSAEALEVFYRTVERAKGIDREDARRATDRLLDLVRAGRHRDTRAKVGLLMHHLAPYLTDTFEDEPFLDALTERGWSREDNPELGSGLSNRHRKGGRPSRAPSEHQEEVSEVDEPPTRVVAEPRELHELTSGLVRDAQAFSRLPIRVQEALLSGHVLDAEVTEPPNTSGFSMVNLVVRHNDTSDKTLSATDRKALINALQVWHMALVFAGHGFAVMQEHRWMAPEQVEERIKDALAIVAESTEFGLSKPVPS
ncbi:helix-turn-helix domain-containing protein [Nonomuraea wenchangensis]